MNTKLLSSIFSGVVILAIAGGAAFATSTSSSIVFLTSQVEAISKARKAEAEQYIKDVIRTESLRQEESKRVLRMERMLIYLADKAGFVPVEMGHRDR